MALARGTAEATERSGAPAASKPGAAESAARLPAGLYLVATPIGNLEDITLRALDTLRRCDAIACEDTRVSAKLLARHGIRRPLLSYHEHNAERMRPALLARIAAGEAIALISDAGTPLVSDPGYKLVRAAAGEGAALTAVPGPSAGLTALILSGLPCDRFLFLGFLPPRQAARRRTLEEVAGLRASLIVFEAAGRLPDLLDDMAAVLGERDAAIARELTKKFEEVRRGGLAELAALYRTEGPPKGEVVVVIGPPGEAAAATEEDADALLRAALADMPVRDAAAAVAKRTGLPRRTLYQRALELAQRK